MIIGIQRFPGSENSPCMKANHEGSGAVWMKQEEVQKCCAANPTTADSKAKPDTETNRECSITLILYLFNIRKSDCYKVHEENFCLDVWMRDASASGGIQKPSLAQFDTRDIIQTTCPRNGHAL